MLRTANNGTLGAFFDDFTKIFEVDRRSAFSYPAVGCRPQAAEATVELHYVRTCASASRLVAGVAMAGTILVEREFNARKATVQGLFDATARSRHSKGSVLPQLRRLCARPLLS